MGALKPPSWADKTAAIIKHSKLKVWILSLQEQRQSCDNYGNAITSIIANVFGRMFKAAKG